MLRNGPLKISKSLEKSWKWPIGKNLFPITGVPLGILVRDKQIVRALQFTQFVCPTFQFIPQWTQKKDTKLRNWQLLLQVLFGTTDGQIIVMSATGAMLTQVIVNEGNEIVSMLWSCEKFNMDETESKSTSTSDQDFITTTGMVSWKDIYHYYDIYHSDREQIYVHQRSGLHNNYRYVAIMYNMDGEQINVHQWSGLHNNYRYVAIMYNMDGEQINVHQWSGLHHSYRYV